MLYKCVKKDECCYGKIKMKADYDLAPDNKMVDVFRSWKSGHDLAIVGSSGSGKTNLVVSLLSKRKSKGKHCSFKNLFHKILIVSPSWGTLKNDIFKDIPPERKFSDFDSDTSDMIEAELDKSEEEPTDDDPVHNLLILDDVGSKLKGGKHNLEKRFVSLLQNRRHLGGGGLSVWTAGQKFRDLSHGHRSNLTHIFVFRPKLVEAPATFEELIGMPKKQHVELIDFVYNGGRHNHLLVDFTQHANQGVRMYKTF
jgi:hypothetical protein